MISSKFPVIIVGAGPGGLVAALALQKHGIPFVIIEKATRTKICSNAGSGFELAPTALDIFTSRLGVPINKITLEYGGAHIQSFQGKVIGDAQMSTPFASVNRAELQNLLLDALFPTADLEEGVLKCGVTLNSYQEDAVNGQVTAYLNVDDDESTLVGCALLGCDGIHSKVRKCMRSAVEDPLIFCNCVAYWAKCPIPSGSALEREFNKTQKHRMKGPSFVIGLGTHYNPGSLFAIPANGKLLWALFFPSEEPPPDADDLTRRGGGILTERGKQELVQKFDGSRSSSILKTILQQTDAPNITEAGIFDRHNLDLPYSTDGKLVAILGDAAHPQSPFAGQGVNMAIADAYVLATRIAMASKADDGKAVQKSILAFDSIHRRESVKKVIKSARSFTKVFISSNRFTCWMIRVVFSVVPLSWILNDVVKYDKSNKQLVEKLEEDYPESNKHSESD